MDKNMGDVITVMIILVAGAIWLFCRSGGSKAKLDLIESMLEEEAEGEEIEAIVTMGDADFVRAMPALPQSIR
ncbi:MAG: hypothetical protein ACI9R3_005094 [Verrucomicrobiales bacterium]|jgi:hypothetical protein